MSDLIHIKGGAYQEYEDLIKKRDELRKDAFIYQRVYTREFGDMILKVFEKKMECIRKKKMIEYCQMIKNHGLMVDQEELQKYLEKEMAPLQNQLNQMMEDNRLSKKCKELSREEVMEIKQIYRRIAKQIHPDMNTLVRENERLMDLWQRVVIAYKCNDLKELREVEFLINMFLQSEDIHPQAMLILDLDRKIQELNTEIYEIQTTNPYSYRYILEDDARKSEKHEALAQELAEYTDYEHELETMVTDTLKQGVTYVWRMQ